jgi:hypothetical protein
MQKTTCQIDIQDQLLIPQSATSHGCWHAHHHQATLLLLLLLLLQLLHALQTS